MTPAEFPEDRDRVADFTRVFDSVIEVIDPTTGKLLLSRRVDPLLAGFADDRHVVSYRVDAWGSRSSRCSKVLLHGSASPLDP